MASGGLAALLEAAKFVELQDKLKNANVYVVNKSGEFPSTVQENAYIIEPIQVKASLIPIVTVTSTGTTDSLHPSAAIGSPTGVGCEKEEDEEEESSSRSLPDTKIATKSSAAPGTKQKLSPISNDHAIKNSAPAAPAAVSIVAATSAPPPLTKLTTAASFTISSPYSSPPLILKSAGGSQNLPASPPSPSKQLSPLSNSYTLNNSDFSSLPSINRNNSQNPLPTLVKISSRSSPPLNNNNNNNNNKNSNSNSNSNNNNNNNIINGNNSSCNKNIIINNVNSSKGSSSSSSFSYSDTNNNSKKKSLNSDCVVDDSSSSSCSTSNLSASAAPAQQQSPSVFFSAQKSQSRLDSASSLLLNGHHVQQRSSPPYLSSIPLISTKVPVDQQQASAQHRNVGIQNANAALPASVKSQPQQRTAFATTPADSESVPLRIAEMRKKLGPSGTREVHNKLEKNRRAHLKFCFELLKSRLPSMKNEKKTSNLTILRSAIRYVEDLKSHQQLLEEEKQNLMKLKNTSERTLENLKHELSQWEHINFDTLIPDTAEYAILDARLNQLDTDEKRMSIDQDGEHSVSSVSSQLKSKGTTFYGSSASSMSSSMSPIQVTSPHTVTSSNSSLNISPEHQMQDQSEIIHAPYFAPNSAAAIHVPMDTEPIALVHHDNNREKNSTIVNCSSLPKIFQSNGNTLIFGDPVKIVTPVNNAIRSVTANSTKLVTSPIQPLSVDQKDSSALTTSCSYQILRSNGCNGNGLFVPSVSTSNHVVIAATTSHLPTKVMPTPLKSVSHLSQQSNQKFQINKPTFVVVSSSQLISK